MMRNIAVKEFEDSQVVAVATFEDSQVSKFWQEEGDEVVLGGFMNYIEGNKVSFEGQVSCGCVCDGCTFTTDGCNQESCNRCNSRTMGDNEILYFPASASIVPIQGSIVDA